MQTEHNTIRIKHSPFHVVRKWADTAGDFLGKHKEFGNVAKTQGIVGA